jgi:hypothetical protein
VLACFEDDIIRSDLYQVIVSVMLFDDLNERLLILHVCYPFRQTWNHVKPGDDAHGCSCVCSESCRNASGRHHEIWLVQDYLCSNGAMCCRVVMRCVTSCTAKTNQELPRSSAYLPASNV